MLTREGIMKIIKVERLDHLGLISGVIKDLRIIEMIDSHITSDGTGSV